MTACPPSEQLRQFLDDRLGADEAALLTVHVANCPECQRHLKELHTLSARLLPPPVTPGSAPPLGATLGVPWPTVPEMPHIPDYTDLVELGRGGMGVVYKARQVSLNRTVALKVLRAGPDADAAELARFQAEAETVARLQHPNIVQIYHVGAHQGRPFLALEYCPGGGLHQKLAGKPLSPDEAATLVEALARALEVVHQVRIVHRDLKPANVLLATDGTPKIADFGLAKRLDMAHQTVSGHILGTPSYMAPEQAAGKNREVGPAADVYALGAILYECLTGRPPFNAPTALETLKQVLQTEPAAPSQLAPGTPHDLNTICLKCLEKEPHKRYAGPRELADDLRRYRNGEPILARPVGAAERLLRWGRRNPAIAGLLGAVATALLLGTAVAWGFALWAHASAEEARQGQRDAEEARLQFAAQKTVAERNERAAVNSREAEVIAKVNAETARQEASNNALEAKLDKQRAEQALLRAERLLYDNKVALALREGQAGDFIRALDLLAECRLEFRGWGHRFLWTLYNRVERGLSGHKAPVRAVAVTPDGKRIASASHDCTVKVWDGDTGQELRTLEHGFNQKVVAVAITPDGKRVASASGPQVHLWDIDSGKEVRRLLGHSGDVLAVALSNDGSRVFSGGADRTVRVWDARTGKELQVFKDQTAAVTCLAITPDGQRVVCGDMSGMIRDRILDTNNGRAFQAGSKAIRAIALSADGKRLVTSGDDPVLHVFDGDTGRHLTRLEGHTDSVLGLAYSHDGNRIASGSGDRTTKLWDTHTGQPILTLRDLPVTVYSVALSGDGKRVVMGSLLNTVKVWDLGLRPESWTSLRRPGAVIAVALSGDGQRAAGAGQDGDLVFWDMGTGFEVSPPNGHRGDVLAVALDRDGGRAVSGGVDGKVKVWDVANRKVVWTLTGHKMAVAGVALSLDGKRVASGSFDMTVRLWDADTGKALRTLSGHTDWVWAVTFADGGRQVVSASQDGTVKVWDAETGKELRTLRGHKGGVLCVAVSGDGRRVVSGGQDGTVRVWDAATGDLLVTLPGNGFRVPCVAISSDGTRAFSGSFPNAIKIWDLTTGQELVALHGHHGLVLGLALSRDGKRLLSGGRDRYARAWDADNDLDYLALKCPHSIHSAAVTADGGRVVSGDGNGIVRLWDGNTGQVLRVLPGHQTPVTAVALSADGERIASFAGHFEKNIPGPLLEMFLWNPKADQPKTLLKEHQDWWHAAALSGDGRRVARANAVGTVKLWDADSGKELWKTDTPNPVIDLALSGDGHRLATRHKNGAIKVWDTDSRGAGRQMVEGNDGHTRCLALSADGKRVAVGFDNGAVRVWDADSGKQVIQLAGDGQVVRQVVLER